MTTGRDRKPGALSADDMLVWRRVARSARPLPGRVLPDEPPAAPEQARPARGAPPSPPPVAKPAPRRPAAPAELSGERRVRRGRLDVDATLDLHGMGLIQARAAVGRFLARARIGGARIVLVVTGKGRGGDGAMRRALPDWLAEEAAHVSGYAPAHARHGGGGAFYVRLRKPPAPDAGA